MPRSDTADVITIVHTQNSIYEVDQENRRVRRTHGLRPPLPNPTRYSDADGWATYQTVQWYEYGLLFTWAIEPNPDGGWIERRTLTSPVVTFDGPPIRELPG